MGWCIIVQSDENKSSSAQSLKEYGKRFLFTKSQETCKEVMERDAKAADWERAMKCCLVDIACMSMTTTSSQHLVLSAQDEVSPKFQNKWSR